MLFRSSCSAYRLVVAPFIPNSTLPALVRLWLVRLRRLFRSAEDLRWTTGECEAFWVGKSIAVNVSIFPQNALAMPFCAVITIIKKS